MESISPSRTPEALKAYHKQYYEDRREAILAKNTNWAVQNPEKYLHNTARQRARRANLEFSIAVSDIVIPEVCPLLEVPFVRGSKYAASIDRIDNSKGYIPGNVQIISWLANRMKNDATEEELMTFCKNFTKHRPDLDDRYKGTHAK